MVKCACSASVAGGLAGYAIGSLFFEALGQPILDLYGYNSDVHVLSAGGLRKAARYIVRVVKDGEALARQTGLVDGRGRPVRGLPPKVVGGAQCDPADLRLRPEQGQSALCQGDL